MMINNKNFYQWDRFEQKNLVWTKIIKVLLYRVHFCNFLGRDHFCKSFVVQWFYRVLHYMIRDSFWDKRNQSDILLVKGQFGPFWDYTVNQQILYVEYWWWIWQQGHNEKYKIGFSVGFLNLLFHYC